MGRGDPRTGRSKVARGTHGKTRPKPSKKRRKEKAERMKNKGK